MAPSRVSTVVELSGHIIDSLTLAKVIDKIQHTGFDYQINDMRIGQRKSDVSWAQLSIWAPSPDALQGLLEELRVYGAFPVTSDEAQTQAVTTDGQLPSGSYVRLNPPMEVHLNGRWLPVEHDGQECTVVVDSERGSARLVPVRTLKAGDQVVIGNHGIKAKPTLAGE